MANLDCPLDRFWNQQGDTSLTMSVRGFPDLVGEDLPWMWVASFHRLWSD